MRFENESSPHRIPQFIGTTAALIAGGVSAAASIAGTAIAGSQQANALEKAGNAELAAREKALQQQLAERSRIENRATEAAKPSLRELEATNRLIADNDKNINLAFTSLQNEIKTLEEATDPAIKAAGQNITNLLKGKAAAALGPVTKQRARQKAELENQLKGRFGSGFRTTTAGIQALQNFDDQTDLVMSDTQNRALTSIGQTFGTLAGARRAGVAGATNLIGTAAQARSAEVQAEQEVARRRQQASTAGLGSQVDFGQVADAAAAPFAGDVARAQTFGKVAGQVGQLGGQFLGFGAGKSLGLKGKDLLGATNSFSIGTPGGGKSNIRTAGG
jgi:hypothetical protein